MQPIDVGQVILFHGIVAFTFMETIMNEVKLATTFGWVILWFVSGQLMAQDADQLTLNAYRQVALQGGDAEQGRRVFESEQAGCAKCHTAPANQRSAGPLLKVIADKYSLDQLITEVLDPSASIHPDYGTTSFELMDGRTVSGIVQRRSGETLELIDAEAKVRTVSLGEIVSEQKSSVSLMPAGLPKSLSDRQFADLIAYLRTLKQDVPAGQTRPGLVSEIPSLNRSIRLEPLHADSLRFDHPVCVIAMPGSKTEFLVVEQQTRRIWRLLTDVEGGRRELYADLSNEAITGQYEGVMCLALHPRYLENGKYYLNYHVREEGVFSPVIVERYASDDRRWDSGKASRRLLRIKQDTDLHWGGMLAFGPDGYLYIGVGDGGPQEDPDGNGQNLRNWRGSILRIDIEGRTGSLPYAIPTSNPYHDSPNGALPEIWASGFRMPWRFSFDTATGDLWVGEIGQYLFEEVTIARMGENHGWNVYEGFLPFSDQYRREGQAYTPPVMCYRRAYGVSVTGGYVYHGRQNKSFEGVYICGDFESRRIFALTQQNRQLTKMRQIGDSPERISSFGVDSDGELLLVGYDGTIFRMILDGVTFE